MMELRLDGLELRQGTFSLAVHGALKAESLGLSGKSGAGKTTFLEALAGLRRPVRGRLALGKRVLDDIPAGLHLAPRERRIGYVPQDADLFPHLSVSDNLLFGSARAAKDKADLTWDRVVEALGLGGLLKRGSRDLSGGERRRVALGRALLSGPELLLLDEPLSGLDSVARASVRKGLKALQGVCAVPWILVSHDRQDLRGLCERTIQVRDGRLDLV